MFRLGTEVRSQSTVDLELFAGAGGLAVGLRMSGFTPANYFESNPICCQTLLQNTSGELPTLVGRVFLGRTEEVDWSLFKSRVRLLAAGAPCQPFSLGGKHTAQRDERNLFPEVLRAVRLSMPNAVLIENVGGMARKSFQPYFDYVLRQLKYPSLLQHSNESWRNHCNRLKKRELEGYPEYSVGFRALNAADFGVPQNRVRIFIVALKTGLSAYEFPTPTHSRNSLLRELRGKDYWERHNLRRRHLTLPLPTDSDDLHKLPWVTVRDAIASLPKPAKNETESSINHWSIPGAKAYPGHTGSQLDWISKTVKAGVHGVPGGENAVVDDKGNFRYLTLRETARLQNFPDEHLFLGTRSQIVKQIGNAVPCMLARAVAKPLFPILKHC